MEESKFVDFKSREVHPRFRSNIFSKYLFIWGFPLLIKGWLKQLTEKDIYKPPSEHQASRLGNELETAWNKEVHNNRNPSLTRVILKSNAKDLAIASALVAFQELIIKLSQPLILGKLLSYYIPTQTTMTIDDAYFYALLLILTNVVYLITSNSAFLINSTIGLKTRVSCSSLIYRKALRLSKAAMEENTLGKMVNLMANDTARFDLLMFHFHSIWLAPIMVLLSIYLMYSSLHPTSLVGMIVLGVFAPGQFFLGKKSSVFRMKTALRTDQRVKLMNEIISGIQIIKMYTWEKPFAYLVEQTRKLEIKQIRAISFVRAINFSFGSFLTRATIYASIVVYVLTGNHLDAEFVFVTMSYYNMLRMVVAIQLPIVISLIAETLVSIKRLQNFFLSEELKKVINKSEPELVYNVKNGGSTNGSILLEPIKKQVGVTLKEASAKWLLSKETTLKNIDLEAGSGQLVAIVGGVGSGKTSLLHVILGELPAIKGYVDISGTVSYASQEPWLFSGSIKQNILFGQPMDMKRYQDVIRVCALSHDLQIMPHGDRTIVGEKGVTLSGGQKARINLARAVYRNADIYLLDDPLAAVDSKVGRQLFENCITTYLKDKCVILVTHQVQYLKAVDKIVLLENGQIAASGTFEEIQKMEHEFLKLFQVEIEEEQEIERRKSMSKEVKNENDLYQPKQVKEHMETGKVTFATYVRYFKSGGNCCVFFLILIGYMLTVLLSSGLDYFLTFWVNQEQDRLNSTKSSNSNLSDQVTNINDVTTQFPVYLTNLTEIPLVTDVPSTADLIDIIFTTENCLYIYTAIIIAIIVTPLTRSLSFYAYCMEASKKIHKSMFSKLLYAPMYFFNTNNSGRILNRFSKDMGAVDEVLPNCFNDSIQTGLAVIANIIIIASINVWILIPSGLLLCLFYFYRSIYVVSSRNLKRMDGTTKSPVFSHFSATVSGLSTIRACGAENLLKNEFDYHQDLNTSAFYMFITANRTFSYWLEINTLLYTSFVILSFLIFGNETYGGNVGLAITQAMNLSLFLQWAIKQSSELENQMTSVERVLEYTDIKMEPDYGKEIPPKSWPENGQIEFRSVSMKYSENGPYVLKNLSFTVSPKEKVGIVGRTGAGKTSLLTALFRLSSNIEGEILIDNIDIKKIPLSTLRSSISVIPQEPILFSGTLRKNLDPFDEYKDIDIWNALEQVELKNVVNELPAGLDSTMSEGGSNFSVGQRQLICLARAVIRNNKILVLDEATANVDPQTDELIQKTIRTRFSDCTVLTIAHRLQTVMDSDKILVMSDGCAAEYDHPHVLLQKDKGHLFGLVQQTGITMANHLKTIAEEGYNTEGKE